MPCSFCGSSSCSFAAPGCRTVKRLVVDQAVRDASARLDRAVAALKCAGTECLSESLNEDLEALVSDVTRHAHLLRKALRAQVSLNTGGTR